MHEIVVPDQGEICCRFYWEYKEKLDVSLIAQFVAHHEVWPKTILHNQIKCMHIWMHKECATTSSRFGALSAYKKAMH